MYVASAEVVVDLVRYLNIDLFSQGIYAISVELSAETGEVGRPYDHFVKGETTGIGSFGEGKTHTKTFYVKYKDQLEVLDTVTKFSIVLNGLRSMRGFGDTLLLKFQLWHLAKEALEKRSTDDIYGRVRGGGTRREAYPPKILSKLASSIGSKKIIKVTIDGQQATLDLERMEEISSDGQVRKIVKMTPEVEIKDMAVVSTVTIPFKFGLLPHTEWVPVVFTNWYFSKIDVHVCSSITGITEVTDGSSAFGIPPSTEEYDLLQEQRFRILCSYLCYAYYLLQVWGKDHRSLYEDHGGRLFALKKDRSERENEVGMEEIDITDFPGSESTSTSSTLTVDLAWEKVEKARNLSPVHVCHFMNTEAKCLQDTELCIKDAKLAVEAFVDSVKPLSEVLSVLSKEVVGAWRHLQEPNGAIYNLKELYSRASFFKSIKEHYKSMLNPVAPPAVPPAAPQYFNFPEHTKIEIHEVFDDETPLSNSRKESAPKVRTEPATGVHLVVLVHGWKGAPTDLSILKNYLQLYIPPGTEFHCVTSMGPTPNSSIKKLGQKVAREVVEYIDDMQLNVGRLSFIGHSMGTIVIRAALMSSHLAPYLGVLWSYISLSGPHLGIAQHEVEMRIGCVVGLLSSVKRTSNIRELRLDTAFLHSLSMNDKLGMFKHVLLFGSEMDTFVAPSSALALSCRSYPKASRKQSMIDDIARNLNMSHSRCVSFRKFRVRFMPHGRKELTSLLDRVVGKSVHIAFLVDIDFLNAVINNFLPYF